MSKNIVLVGFMGAGKTAVGGLLAQKLNLQFMDLDPLIEERENRTIPEIFSQKGEAYFRQIEKEIVKEASEKKGWVIACGGGVVLDNENIGNLKKTGILIYLKASPEVIFKRTKGKTHRPLLNVDDPEKRIAELLNFRESHYQQADYTIDTSSLTVNEVVSAILKILKNE